MYKKVGTVSPADIGYLKAVLTEAKWKDVIGSGADFKTWFCNVDLKAFPDYSRSFFILLPPGGRVHRHADTPRAATTYHIPVMTNKHCFNNMFPGGDFHLEVGKIYEVNRLIEHESVNNGETDRIHLLIETNLCLTLH